MHSLNIITLPTVYINTPDLSAKYTLKYKIKSVAYSSQGSHTFN